MSTQLFDLLAEEFQNRERELAVDVRTAFEEDHDVNYDKLSKQQVDKYITELIIVVGKSFKIENPKEVNKLIEDWIANFAHFAVSSGVSADSAMLFIPYFRKVIFKAIRESDALKGISLDNYYLVADHVHPQIDHVIYRFTSAYTDLHNKSFNEARTELLELAVPVVPLTKEVALLPLIGTIDTHRAQHLLDNSLEKGRALGLSYLIIDLSGVYVIDTAIAHNLFKLNDSLKIIGITAVLSGLRPEVVQTIVSLGLSFQHMEVVNNLEHALKRTGLQIDARS